MGSLQEQLLKAGIVDQNKLKKVRTDKRKKKRQHAKPKKSEPAVQVLKDSSNLAEYAKIQKQAKDRKFEEQRKKAEQRRELAAQIKQLIDNGKLDRSEGEVPYQFLDGKKIKKILITPDQQQKLSRQQLGIVKHGGSYELVSNDVVEKIRQRDPSRVLSLNSVQSSKSDNAEDDYAEFAVPDDLMW